MRRIVVMLSVSLDGYFEGPTAGSELAPGRRRGAHRFQPGARRDERLPRRPGHLRAHGRVLADGGRRPGRARRRWPSSPASGGTCRRSSTPGPWRRPTGTPPSSGRSIRTRSAGSRPSPAATWPSAAPTSSTRSAGWTSSTSTGSTCTRFWSAADDGCSRPRTTLTDLRLVETRTFGNGVVLLRHERVRS